MKPILFIISFLIAFLLFVVQPMVTKLVLPTLGGTPAVWNTAMLSFQTLLLLGYLYAHLTTSRLQPRAQLLLHGGLVLCSFLFLPLAVMLEANDTAIHHPIWAMTRALVLQLGLPFFVLASTAPLLQAWVSRSDTSMAKTPYVLYSASNLGSLLALVGYVLAIEPLFDLSTQRQLWSILYGAGTVILLLTGWRLVQAAPSILPSASRSVPITRNERAIWIGLAFLPSALSLGVTNYIAVDIASVPLLWVLPLAIYLLSFVDAFRARPLLVTGCMRVAPLIGLIALLLYGMQANRALYGFVFHILAFFTLAFALHGHLARYKPEPGKLTAYYLCLSVGGMLGGVLNALVAPMLLTEPMEYPVTLLAASVVAFLLLHQQERPIRLQLREMFGIVVKVVLTAIPLYFLFALLAGELTGDHPEFNTGTMMIAASASGTISLLLRRGFNRAYAACVGVMILMLCVVASGVHGYSTIFRDRNFYGVEKVFDRTEPHARYMLHNTTLHGTQSLDPNKPLRPVSYYAALREVFDSLNLRRQPVAAIGLGIGSVQCYAGKNQPFDYFEINPLVVQLADDPHYFRYLSDCPGTHRLVLGDGRIMIAREADDRYGTIILDAFSSDAIPAHLLTKEAFAVYASKLKPKGVILIHTTNRHIDLWPLIGLQAKAMGLQAFGKNFKAPADDPLVSETYWVILAQDRRDIAPLIDGHDGWQALQPDAGARAWSDQYSNILPYLKLLR